jgi:hypothetical protein
MGRFTGTGSRGSFVHGPMHPAVDCKIHPALSTLPPAHLTTSSRLSLSLSLSHLVRLSESRAPGRLPNAPPPPPGLQLLSPAPATTDPGPPLAALTDGAAYGESQQQAPIFAPPLPPSPCPSLAMLNGGGRVCQPAAQRPTGPRAQGTRLCLHFNYPNLRRWPPTPAWPPSAVPEAGASHARAGRRLGSRLNTPVPAAASHARAGRRLGCRLKRPCRPPPWLPPQLPPAGS